MASLFNLRPRGTSTSGSPQGGSRERPRFRVSVSAGGMIRGIRAVNEAGAVQLSRFITGGRR